MAQNEKIVRFCPSPTGFFHVGNARIAIINYLFKLKYKAKFLLRIDDTDTLRCKSEYEETIMHNLKWLGIEHDILMHQSKRIDRYKEVLEAFIKSGRVYACFETEEELEFKRKRALAQKNAPVYDRQGLSLTKEQRDKLIQEGRKPYYRFLLSTHATVQWNDGVFGDLSYNTKDMSDPVVVRANGDFLYTFCSVIDDYDTNVTHIIRGADHISNTAVQIDLFNALSQLLDQKPLPNFVHLPLFKTKEGKISKRVGGFAIKDYIEEGVEAMSIINAVSKIGRSTFDTDLRSISELVEDLNFEEFNTSTTIFDKELIYILNHKFVSNMSFEQAKSKLSSDISVEFFDAIKPICQIAKEVEYWHDLIVNLKYKFGDSLKADDLLFVSQIAGIMQENRNNWQEAVKQIKAVAPERKGPTLFMPIRFALTGLDHGPELKDILRFMPVETLLYRLKF